MVANEESDGNSESNEGNDKNKVRVVLVHERDDDAAKDRSDGQDAERNGHHVQKRLLLLGSFSVQRALHGWCLVHLKKNKRRKEKKARSITPNEKKGEERKKKTQGKKKR